MLISNLSCRKKDDDSDTHIPSGFCVVTTSRFEDHDYKLHCYTGDNVMDEFFAYILNLSLQFCASLRIKKCPGVKWVSRLTVQLTDPYNFTCRVYLVRVDPHQTKVMLRNSFNKPADITTKE